MMDERPLTDGTIALLNLDAQIDALEPEVRIGPASVETRSGLAELIALRGLIVGCIADYDRANEIAEQLVRDVPTDPHALLARARTHAGFHRFNDALADIECAEQLSLDAETANGERAAIFQALGRYDESLVLREEAAKRRASFEHVAALVGLHAERGEIEATERRYEESRSQYRGVSPIPLALLDFQLGLMWMNEGQLDNARRSFSAAQRRVPAYAPAGKAISPKSKRNWVRLIPPFPACTLWRNHPMTLITRHSSPAFSGDVGREGESRYWRQVAAARYDELIANHPEAFADHAAEFWLAAGADPDKALQLAKMNLEVRNTPRARSLLAQAVAAQSASSSAECHENVVPPCG
jgi:tetratricopeptide (TPR) repeat protein